jgi:hypothetical protein
VPDSAIISPVTTPPAQPIAFAEEERKWIGYELVEDPSPADAAPTATAKPAALKYRAKPTAAPQRVAAAAGGGQWPALSRVRDGLQTTAARREPPRDPLTSC